MKQFEGQNILVAGLGVTGLAVLEYFFKDVQQVPQKLVAVSDEIDNEVIEGLIKDAEEVRKEQGFSLLEIEFECYKTSDALARNTPAGRFDICIVSPGIAPNTDFYKWCERVSDELISEPELAFRAYERTWIAITGTNGKTTTTALVEHILNSAGVPAVAVGNIGLPSILAAKQEAVIVAELSSFQLHNISKLKPRVSAVLNISPDHLNWHEDLAQYASDKARIFMNAGICDTIILNASDTDLAQMIEEQKARGATIIAYEPNNAAELLNAYADPLKLQIKGAHNYFNALVAATAASVTGVSIQDIERGLLSFKPVPHRLEFVGEIRAVRYYNDSKATNPEASMAALDSFTDEKFHLLLGGKNKGNSFTELFEKAFLKENLCSVILFGEASEEIKRDFDALVSTRRFVNTPRCIVVKNLRQAFLEGYLTSKPEESVVLSPACASFDEFNSFEHRGEYFCSLMSEIQAGN